MRTRARSDTELTPSLDALMVVDAPGGDLWTGYDLRAGRPPFSFDGETCVHRGGCGAFL